MRLASVLILAGLLNAQQLDPVEKKIAAAVDAGFPKSLALLEKVVNINSGTMNLEGVRRVADVLRPEFEALGFQVRWVPMDRLKRAGHLVAERQGSQGKRLLLVGHMDTVFEPSSPFQKFVRRGDIAEGPGVDDMKGGLVVMLYALKALHAAGALEGTRITAVLTGDEESPGEPLSLARADLIEAGKRSDAALEFEAGHRTDGRDFATIARRGYVGWRLRTTGNGGHSSQVFGEKLGYGAIYEMARILTAFQEQLREPDLTFNAGLIAGGTTTSFDASAAMISAASKANIVPAEAIAHGDLRALTQEQVLRTQRKMREIVARHLPGTKAVLEFEDGYPPMSPTGGNRNLLRILNTVNRDLNLEAMDALPPSLRGAGDISFVAPFVDSLSGFGAIGSGAHAPGETIDLPRMPVQMKRAALMIYRLTR
ncbi:MAG: M20/M25/M40 family metallo-hydrolase [Bryobacteraceae bacterium]|nr:M20/M25/M40 family metallo-hydrolase [Bryobacteraceae bacterium]